MAQKPPLNIRILDPNKYVQEHQALPVSNPAIFESSSRRFHPDGFFSEVIFGPSGSNERLVHRGYVDLHTDIISPHLFHQVKSLKSFYQDVMASKVYAYFDEDTHDLVKTTMDDPRGETGYSFFLRVLPQIQFATSESIKRKDKIALLAKYKDLLFTDKLIILPAGVRDVKQDADRIAPEQINKFYFGLLALTRALPEQKTDNKLYDPIRYQIQMKVQQIYAYILGLVDGKGGFAQRKFASRHIAYSSRNVITAAVITRTESPDSKQMFQVNEVMFPLFQCLKNSVPLITYWLKSIFTGTIFNLTGSDVPLIDPDTRQLVYVEVDSAAVQKFTTSNGVNELINSYRDTEMHWRPVAVKATQHLQNQDITKDYWLYLVYDTGDTITYIRDVEAFKQTMQAVDQRDTYKIQLREHLAALPSGHYLLVGNSALQYYGYKTTTTDLDVLLEPKYYQQAIASDDYIAQPDGTYRHQTLPIHLCNAHMGLDFYPIKDADATTKIDGCHVASLITLEMMYQKAQRLKDKAKVKFIAAHIFDESRLRPLTWTEMFYVTAHEAMRGKHAAVTRYPVLLIENLVLDKVHLTSTTNTRSVLLRANPAVDATVELSEYPIINTQVKTSMSVHPAHLAKYDGKNGCRQVVRIHTNHELV